MRIRDRQYCIQHPSRIIRSHRFGNYDVIGPLTAALGGVGVCVEAVLANLAVPAGRVALTQQTLAGDRVTGGRVGEVSHATAVAG